LVVGVGEGYNCFSGFTSSWCTTASGNHDDRCLGFGGELELEVVRMYGARLVVRVFVTETKFEERRKAPSKLGNEEQ
jgi:hypothetical protein